MSAVRMARGFTDRELILKFEGCAQAWGQALSAAGIGIHEFSLAQPSLDDVFFALTGRPAEDQAQEEPA